jgi:hypothetical protein
MSTIAYMIIRVVTNQCCFPHAREVGCHSPHFGAFLRKHFTKYIDIARCVIGQADIEVARKILQQVG